EAQDDGGVREPDRQHGTLEPRGVARPVVIRTGDPSPRVTAREARVSDPTEPGRSPHAEPGQLEVEPDAQGHGPWPAARDRLEQVRVDREPLDQERTLGGGRVPETPAGAIAVRP